MFGKKESKAWRNTLFSVIRQHCGLQFPHRHRAALGVGGHRPLPKHRLRADSHVFTHPHHRSKGHLAQYAYFRGNDIDGQHSAGAGFVETSYAKLLILFPTLMKWSATRSAFCASEMYSAPTCGVHCPATSRWMCCDSMVSVKLSICSSI